MRGHEFTHHKAGSDAETAGHLLLAMMKEKREGLRAYVKFHKIAIKLPCQNSKGIPAEMI